jgi:HSP20 family protein
MAIIPWNGPDIGNFSSAKRFPRIDVRETETAIIAEIGEFKVSPESFEISIRSGILFIKNELLCEDGKAIGKFRNKNKTERNFEKVVKLPVGIDVQASRAVVENGIIRVTVPKAKGKSAANKQLAIETS